MDFTRFLQKAEAKAPKAHLPFSLVEGGLPQGSLIELSGAAGGGKIEALLRFLAENSALQVAWIEEGSTTYPCAFPQHGVSLERVLFIHGAPSATQSSLLMDCAHQILRSQIFGALVLLPFPPHNHTLVSPRGSRSTNGAFRPELRGFQESSKNELGEIALRRLQIAAQKSGTTVFIVRETASRENTWPLSAQLHVQRRLEDGKLHINVLKQKFRPLGPLHQALA